MKIRTEKLITWSNLKNECNKKNNKILLGKKEKKSFLQQNNLNNQQSFTIGEKYSYANFSLFNFFL